MRFWQERLCRLAAAAASAAGCYHSVADPETQTSAPVESVREMSRMAHFRRRGTIGMVAGLIAGIALVATLHNLVLGLVFGATIGVVYSIMSDATPFAYAESIFTAGTLGILLWSVFSIIVLPILSGHGPQWSAEGMRALFPQFVGWVLYGAGVGLVAQALNDVALNVLGPEPVASP